MTKNHIFQMDVNDPSSWMLYYGLHDVFRLADPNNAPQTFKAMQEVFDQRNIIDETVHPDSPRRNRPAYLDYPSEHWLEDGEKPQPFKKSSDWSVLGR